jgi:hypothetical protein
MSFLDLTEKGLPHVPVYQTLFRIDQESHIEALEMRAIEIFGPERVTRIDNTSVGYTTVNVLLPDEGVLISHDTQRSLSMIEKPEGSTRQFFGRLPATVFESAK